MFNRFTCRKRKKQLAKRRVSSVNFAENLIQPSVNDALQTEKFYLVVLYILSVNYYGIILVYTSHDLDKFVHLQNMYLEISLQ